MEILTSCVNQKLLINFKITLHLRFLICFQDSIVKSLMQIEMFYLCSVPSSPWPQQSLFDPMMGTGQILEHVAAIQACLQHTSLCWRGSQLAAISANCTVLLACGAVVDCRGKKRRYGRRERSCRVQRGVIFSFVILSVKPSFVFH